MINKKVVGWATIAWLPLVAWIGYIIVQKIEIEKNCIGYLKRASNANTVVLAEQELSIALTYLERQGLTKGYTSILYKTPDEDIGFFYQNLLASQKELQALKLKEELTSLEQSNALLKLRDTLTDHSQGAENVTHPPGLYMYPQNTGSFGFIILLLCWGGIVTLLYVEPK